MARGNDRVLRGQMLKSKSKKFTTSKSIFIPKSGTVRSFWCEQIDANQGLFQPAPGMHRFVQLKMADSSWFWDQVTLLWTYLSSLRCGNTYICLSQQHKILGQSLQFFWWKWFSSMLFKKLTLLNYSKFRFR